jgi:asparagine synthase (glutamine-hydrolysing)
MCGIIGFIEGTVGSIDYQNVLRRMSDTLIHRGPDDGGYWYDAEQRFGVGHRRLAIVDLSPAGHQPMVSISGRYVIALNGEVYNHLALRAELESIPSSPLFSSREILEWKGHSDTETLLAGFEAWGIEATLKKIVGMFAIALWDRKEKVLTLARDRMGEKPLYYGFQNRTFIFGSELKALKVHPDFLGEIDRDVICLYLRHCYIPAPYSIYKGIKKLLPGTYLQLQFAHEFSVLKAIEPKAYWDLSEIVAKGQATRFEGGDEDAIVALDAQLRQSIGLQMMADVPLGAFLSGGVDSSTVVALMQAQSMRPVKTFSIGFDEAGFNEAEYAKAVAQQLGTEHTDLYVSSAEAMQVIPLLGRMYDEPFADSSQIPTYLVSKMAKQHVTVALSGDAGDELFSGYNHYMLADSWQRIEYIPFGVRKLLGRSISSVSQANWKAFFHKASNLIQVPENMSERISNLSMRLMNVDGVNALYHDISSQIDCPEKIVIGAKEPTTRLTEMGGNVLFSDVKNQMMYIDSMMYLPDDILVKVDRAAMANSLETRVPLLDHRLVELAWRLPMSMKMREGKTKWILRQVLYRYVPQHLIERPKAGFSIPLGDWLRGPLREWAEVLLNMSRLKQEGYFDAIYIREKWQAYLGGTDTYKLFLWNVLMFQVWLEEQH